MDIKNNLLKLRKPEIPEISSPTEIREVKAYPVSLEGKKEISSAGPEYEKVSGDQLLSIAASNPSSISFKKEPNGGISYYVNVTSRRKHIKNVNIKRVIYRLKKIIKKPVHKKIVKKIIKPKTKSRSANIKQNILNKLKCVCRRKKK